MLFSFVIVFIISFLIGGPSVAWSNVKNKSGVAPQILTLPKGGGTVKGLGETFSPNLNSGTGSYNVPLTLPPGRNSFSPSLSLNYSSGRGSGNLGVGWEMGVSQISRRTEKGIPRYDDDEDIFIFDGMELVQVSSGQFRPRHEGFFGKIFFRKNNNKKFWEVWTKSGERLVFGNDSNSRIENGKKIFSWLLSSHTDSNGNKIHYYYAKDGETNRHLSRIEYAIYAVDFSYESRTDLFSSFRSGFEVKTSLRCNNIFVRLNIRDDDSVDRIRRFSFSYEPSPGSRLSLLKEIKQFGTDDSAFLPPLSFFYSQFDPKRFFHSFTTASGSPPASLNDPNYELADINADGLSDVLLASANGHIYWLNQGDDSWAPAQQLAGSPQGVQLADDGVLLADMNGDGKSDLLFSQGSSFGYWQSYGDKKWSEFIEFNTLPNISFKDPNVRLMDVNGDGLTDVIHTTHRFFTYWLNLNGKDWSLPVSRSFSSIFKEPNVPGTFFSEQLDSDARMADMNGDGLQDLVSVHNGWIRYWPHKGLLRFEKNVAMNGTPRLPLNRFDRSRFLIGDINHDGFADLLYVDISQVFYWLNFHGEKWSERNEIKSTPYAQGTVDVRLADMNGNGTRDLVWSTPVRSGDRTNYRYFDFVGKNRFPNLLTKIDNGMGMVTKIEYKSAIDDFIQAKRKGRPWIRKLPFSVKVVSSVRLTDHISHTDVITRYSYADGYYDGRDREFRGFERADERSIGDSSSPDSLTTHYFYVGFGERLGQKEAEKARSLKGQLKRTAIYGLDGGPLESKPYQIISHSWKSVVLDEFEVLGHRGEKKKRYVVFPFLSGSLTSTYERTDSPRHTAASYEYDLQYGTVKNTTEYGEVKGWQPTENLPYDVPVEDKRITTSHFAIKNNQQTYIVQLASEITKNKDGKVFSEREYYYDGEPFKGLPLGKIEQGNLHRIRERVLTPELINQAYGDIDFKGFGDIPINEWIDTARYQYENFGLLKSFMDAHGKVVLSVEYDLHDLSPVKATNSRNHVEEAQYDYRFGQIIRHTDSNQAVTEYMYDKLGLVERVVRPGDSYDYPTAWYRYNLHTAPLPPYVTTWLRERPPNENEREGNRLNPSELTQEKNSYVSRSYFDGLGRMVQSRTETNGGVVVSGWTTFNAKGHPKTQYLPFFSNGFDYVENQRANSEGTDANLKMQMFYDPLGQLIKTINPNNSFKEVRNLPWQSKHYDEEDLIPNGPHYDTPKKIVSDAFGRLIEVTEYANKQRSPIKTGYKYDLNGNLIEITDATKKSKNRRNMIYDLFGQKLMSFEPNTGTRHYFYDKNGNLIYRRDNKGQWVKYGYDELNRLIQKFYITLEGSKLVEAHHYDEGEGSNLVGHMSRVEDLSGEMTYSYDKRGRIVIQSRRLDGLDKEYITDFGYDSMDRLKEVIYPNIRHTRIAYKYDKGNHLQSIPGYVKQIEYNSKSQRTHILYENGVDTQYLYDPKTFWLKSVLIRSKDGTKGDLSHRVYQYDEVGNIRSIEEKVQPNNLLVYEYDALYRLLHAQSHGVITYDIKYDYDVIGNLIQKSDLDPNELNYAKDGKPHTLDHYGTVTLTYDKNGNLSQTPEMQLSWDYEDRLLAIEKNNEKLAEYVYDSNGLRTKKSVENLDQANITYYINKYIDIRNGREEVFIFADDNRIALIDDGGKQSFYHGDHLESIKFRSDSKGKSKKNSQIYAPYGAPLTRPTGGAEAEDLKGPYQFNDKEYDRESGFYYFGARYYEPRIGRWISPDPLISANPTSGLKIPGRLNLYSFVLGSPINFRDLYGLQEVLPSARVQRLLGNKVLLRGPSCPGGCHFDQSYKYPKEVSYTGLIKGDLFGEIASLATGSVGPSVAGVAAKGTITYLRHLGSAGIRQGSRITRASLQGVKRYIGKAKLRTTSSKKLNSEIDAAFDSGNIRLGTYVQVKSPGKGSLGSKGPKETQGPIWYHDNISIPGVGPGGKRVWVRTHSTNPKHPAGYTTQINTKDKRYLLPDGSWKKIPDMTPAERKAAHYPAGN